VSRDILFAIAETLSGLLADSIPALDLRRLQVFFGVVGVTAWAKGRTTQSASPQVALTQVGSAI